MSPQAGHGAGCDCVVCRESRVVIEAHREQKTRRALREVVDNARGAGRLEPLGTVQVAGTATVDWDGAGVQIELRDRTVRHARLEIRVCVFDSAECLELDYGSVTQLRNLLGRWLSDLDRRKLEVERRAPLEKSGGGRRTLAITSYITPQRER